MVDTPGYGKSFNTEGTENTERSNVPSSSSQHALSLIFGQKHTMPGNRWESGGVLSSKSLPIHNVLRALRFSPCLPC